MSRRRRHARSSAAAPLDDDDLLCEILLRLPPQPSSLPRASLVCKRWRSLVSDPGFFRRFRLCHRRNPPLLGFFDRFARLSFLPTLEAPNRVPRERFSFQCADFGSCSSSLGCRDGLMLLFLRERLQVLVWDPITGDQHRIAIPAAFDTKKTLINGVVLRAADKSLVSCYCLMKISEMKKKGIFGIGFIDPNTVNEETWEMNEIQQKGTEDDLLTFLKHLNINEDILLPYNFKFHWVLLNIHLDESRVEVFDSLVKDPKDYTKLMRLVNRVWVRFIREVPGHWEPKLYWHRVRWMSQASGNNLCAFYVCENIRITTIERTRTARQLWFDALRDKLLEPERILALQEKIAGFLLDQVINPEGEFHYKL